MKRNRSWGWLGPAFLLLAALAGAWGLSGCAAAAARQRVGLPALRDLWSDIRVEVHREATEIQDQLGHVELVKADAALDSGNPQLFLVVAWEHLERLAAGDVARREATGAIGPGVAAVFRESHIRFRQLRIVYLRQP